MSTPNQIQVAYIEDFSKKGNGIGYFEREDGVHCSVEVPFTLPGDCVQIKLFGKKKGVYQSRLETIITPSSDRISPRCNHFGLCGGCRFQQMTYEHQLHLKEQSVLNDFSSLLKISDIELSPILPAPNCWNYRNKMEYTFSRDRANNLYLGLIMDASKGKVFHLTECHLPNPWFVDAVRAARKWWFDTGLDAYHPRSDTGSLQTLTLREGMNTQDRMVNLSVSGNPDYALKREHLESFTDFMLPLKPSQQGSQLSLFMTIKQIKKGYKTQFYEWHLFGSDHIREVLHIRANSEKPKAFSFKISPAAFFQPNTEQAEKLYTKALTLAEIPQNCVVYDLYCGIGVLGILAAKEAKQVIGIELSKEACLDARENMSLNHLDNMTVIQGSVDEVINQKNEQLPTPDVVFVDPPRCGLLDEAIKGIVRLNPKKLVYISCNPKSQVEDVKKLLEADYQIRAIQPIDQFPHTIHLENIVVLVKR